MSVNKKIGEKELETVTGGGCVDANDKTRCPSCGHFAQTDTFNVEYTDEGCTHYGRYTCPNCGHVWTE